MGNKKASDKELINSYKKLGNVWKVGKEFGMCGQSIHERLTKLNINLKYPRFTKEETNILERDYLVYRDAGKLDSLAKQMGRTKQFLARKAGEMKLTDPSHKKKYLSVWKYMPEEIAMAIFDKFKQSSYGLGQYCKRHGYASLGFSLTMKKYFGDEWDHVIEAKQPRQTRYCRGRQFEYRCRDQLRLLGYFVLRSPRSGSPVDLVAIKKGILLFVQCKRGGCLDVKGWNDIYDLSMSVEAIPLLANIPKSQKGAEYFKLIGRKDGTRRKQPMEPYSPK